MNSPKRTPQRGSQRPVKTSQRNPTGSISLIFGPMFSGKSTELLRRCRRFAIAKERVMVVKYSKDKRYSTDSVSTHDRQEMEAINATVLADVAAQAKDYDVIGIDEGQFFPDAVEFCETMAQQGKTIIVAALDGTFQRKAFGSILELVPLAEYVVKLSAVCMVCSADAAFSKRIVEGTEIEVIGGSDMYVAVCRECFNIGEAKPVPFAMCQGAGKVLPATEEGEAVEPAATAAATPQKKSVGSLLGGKKSLSTPVAAATNALSPGSPDVTVEDATASVRTLFVGGE